MSYSKASDLIELAMMASARHAGVTLVEIMDRFNIEKRTAQRMTDALASVFPNVELRVLPDRRHAWKLLAPIDTPLSLPPVETVEALDLAVREAQDAGRHHHARTLLRLRDSIVSSLPANRARAAESDAEAVLQSIANVARPGPRGRVAPDVAEAIYDALRGPYRLDIAYRPASGELRTRRIEPHGVLLGPRSYLVAHVAEDRDLRHFRMDRIVHATCTDEWFALDPEFQIERHAAEAFGSYHDPGQIGPVVWSFSAKAAPAARNFVFHPDQIFEDQDDGGLIVRFTACGWLEMAWFLYQWGSDVEVLEPAGLRELVAPGRRTFDATP
ncbi:helix-turn-helix transcriptional regulator [Sedimentimonas flavescens]|uniref:helix-turn-helix transcriptional regulator n=1 Tax=Sedimentimonas flavescens TaxID=2851012 RepID=UPI001C49E77E|nr:WYL domain-containing protein [Sedimentimonas flavescens]MBW0157612.1 WYL domain-containing protein [Sedimentimonas flavescens]